MLYYLALIILSFVKNVFDAKKISGLVFDFIGLGIYIILSIHVLGDKFLDRFYLFKSTFFFFNFSLLIINIICFIIDSV